MSLSDTTAAIQLAESRWQSFADGGDAGSDSVLFELATVLSRANRRLGDFDAMGRYAERSLLLAEGMSDPSALARALSTVALRYSGIGAPVAARMMWDQAARLARENDLFEPLSRCLMNLASNTNSRDLSAALDYSRDALVAAHRSGSQMDIDYAGLNHLIALWLTGDMATTGSALSDALDTATDPGIRISLRTIEAWLADAQGQPVPEPTDDQNPLPDDESDRAWQDSADISRAMAAHDPAHAASIAADSVTHLLAAVGIDEDFCILWPPLVLAALAAGDVDLADRLLQPVETARPGLVSPGSCRAVAPPPGPGVGSARR